MAIQVSILALFRFELLNYFSIPVELRIRKCLPTNYIGRTNESPSKSENAHRHRQQQSDTPNNTSLIVEVSHGSCRHLSARSGKPSPDNMCVDIGTQYPHKHHNYSHCSDLSTVDPKVKDHRFHKNGDPVSPTRRAGFDASHLGSRAMVKQEWLYVCQPLTYATDASSVGSMSTVIYPRPQQLAFPLTVT